MSDQIEFLNRIRRRSKPNQVVRYLVVIHAVENEVVCLLAVAVDVRPSSAGGVVAVVETLRIRWTRARRQQSQLYVIPRRERKLVIRLRIDDGVYLRGLGL